MAENRADDSRDPFGNPSGFSPSTGAFGESGGQTRNRPAAGAREVDSPQAAETRWQPGPGATDFLGLEPELHAGDESSAGGATESWLFDVQQADAQFAPVATATPTRAATAAANTTTVDPETSLENFSDEPVTALEDEAQEARTPGHNRSKRGLLLVAGLAVLGAGGYFAWKRFAPRIPSGPEIARVDPKPAAARPAKPEPTKPVVPAATTPAPIVTSPDATPPIPEATPAPMPVEVAADPVSPREDLTNDSTASATVEPAPPILEPTSSLPEPVAPLARSSAPIKDPELPTGAPGPGGGRHATASDWAGMWLETTIPKDAIHGPTRVRTLNVGYVRAELRNGEFIEGRLNAVGESRIWLDVELGRISLDATELRGLSQIVGQQGRPIAIGSQALAGLPRVEVLLPGGSMFGRVLGREGDLVTFITEEGMRVRVDALDIRPAAEGRMRLVGPIKDRKP